MKVKKPKLTGPGYGYLGHFAKDKFVAQGHNDSGSVELQRKALKRKYAKRLVETANDDSKSNETIGAVLQLELKRAGIDPNNEAAVVHFYKTKLGIPPDVTIQVNSLGAGKVDQGKTEFNRPRTSVDNPASSEVYGYNGGPAVVAPPAQFQINIKGKNTDDRLTTLRHELDHVAAQVFQGRPDIQRTNAHNIIDGSNALHPIRGDEHNALETFDQIFPTTEEQLP